MSKLFDGKLVFTQIPLLLKYLPVTMELAVTAMIASLILGLLLALVKIKKVPVLKQLIIPVLQSHGRLQAPRLSG